MRQSFFNQTNPAWPSWNSAVSFYQELAETEPAWSSMAEFTQQISESRYHEGLYPGMSHATLLIAQTPRFVRGREVLEIEFVTKEQRLRFDFFESPDARQHWSRECEPAAAFALLEKLLWMKRWFLTSRSAEE